MQSRDEVAPAIYNLAKDEVEQWLVKAKQDIQSALDALNRANNLCRLIRPQFADNEEIRHLAEVEKNAINRALEFTEGNIALAAKKLGIARGTLYNKMKEYKIDDVFSSLANDDE